MNYMYLERIFNKSPKEVYEFLSQSEGTYVDINTGAFISEFKKRVLTVDDNKEFDFPFLEKYLKTDRDFYENFVTNLSWKNLDKYLEGLYTVEDLEHAAFILDIATRNCIPLRSGLYTDMLRFRQRSIYIQYRYEWQEKTVSEIIKEANQQVFKMLNVLIYKDAFVRY